jgi:hypothetical protein
MILLVAVLAGLAAGLLRARIRRQSYQVPEFKLVWLVILALIPQWLAFGLPVTRSRLNIEWVATALIGSQVILLGFAWINRMQPGMWLLGIGLMMNLAVISLNGGLMPIPPEAVAHLAKANPELAWQVGERLGTGKDIVLNAEATKLWFLSDRLILLPDNPGYQVAYSVGDVFIAAGAFWLLWRLGGPGKSQAPLHPLPDLKTDSDPNPGDV